MSEHILIERQYNEFCTNVNASDSSIDVELSPEQVQIILSSKANPELGML